MSAKERERLHVIRQVSERRTGQARAAELLGIGVRQVKRLVLMWWTAPAPGIEVP